jgi:hypothetical protein
VTTSTTRYLRDIKEYDNDGEFACDAARGMVTITQYKLKYGEGLASLIIWFYCDAGHSRSEATRKSERERLLLLAANILRLMRVLEYVRRVAFVPDSATILLMDYPATASEHYAALFRAKWVHVIIIDQTMSLPPLADCKAIEVYIRDKGLNDEAMLLEHVVLCFSAFVADLKAKRLTATQQATLEYGDDHDTIIRIISQFIAETMCRILTEISPTLLTWSSIFLPPVYFNHRCVDYFAGRVGVVCGFKIGFQTSTSSPIIPLALSEFLTKYMSHQFYL